MWRKKRRRETVIYHHAFCWRGLKLSLFNEVYIFVFMIGLKNIAVFSEEFIYPF